MLYDSFAQPEADHDDIAVLVDNPHARHVAVHAWNFHPALVDGAMAKGASGYLSKTLPAHELVIAIEAIADGKVVISDGAAGRDRRPGSTGPGASKASPSRGGRSSRSITQASPTARSPRMMYLSIHTVKTYIRSPIAGSGVTGRSHAMLWGLDHGFQPDHHRIDH